jgi:hypothetical protein
VIGPVGLEDLTVWEPACNRGSMARPLAEHFGSVHSTHIADCGYGQGLDFLTSEPVPWQFDWIITNPPFRLAEAFILRVLAQARVGVAMLCRIVLLESAGRYEGVFLPSPPRVFAQFTERVPMFRGGSITRARRRPAMPRSCGSSIRSRLAWVPPCRKILDREGDHEPTGQDLSPSPP